jgi:tRNA threonylcarbamoyladenosine biosynthesis protein TsaB
MTVPSLLCLETATGVCSVLLSRGNEVLAIRISKEEREHAAMLAIYIEQVLSEAQMKLSDIDAVVVSKGPGSYTGLRIGVATAKGICYTLDKKLIAIDTPLAMAADYREQHPELSADAVLVPMIDARRMEVYGAALDIDLNYLEPIRAEILTNRSFVQSENRPHYIFGDAAAKTVEVFNGESFVNVDTEYNLSARGLLSTGLRAWNSGAFEDIAYFEPYYLKEFVTKQKQS